MRRRNPKSPHHFNQYAENEPLYVHIALEICQNLKIIEDYIQEDPNIIDSFTVCDLMKVTKKIKTERTVDMDGIFI